MQEGGERTLAQVRADTPTQLTGLTSASTSRSKMLASVYVIVICSTFPGLFLRQYPCVALSAEGDDVECPVDRLPDGLLEFRRLVVEAGILDCRDHLPDPLQGYMRKRNCLLRILVVAGIVAFCIPSPLQHEVSGLVDFVESEHLRDGAVVEEVVQCFLVAGPLGVFWHVYLLPFIYDYSRYFCLSSLLFLSAAPLPVAN